MNTAFVSFLSLTFLLASALPGSEKGAPSAPPTPAESYTDEQPASRLVKYGERDVIAINTKLRHATLIVLPQGEKILDFVCGDAEYWVINGAENFAHVKPARQGSSTNLNLIAASGRVYSFSLQEISKVKGATPDLKVFVQPKERSTLARTPETKRFVAAEELAICATRLEEIKSETVAHRQEAQQRAQEQIQDFQARYPLALRFVYSFPFHGKKPFNLMAIYHDGRFTYIQAHPTETPALYEVKDKKPSLIQYQYRDGVYVVPKILDRGYLAIGKRRLPFVRRGNNP